MKRLSQFLGLSLLVALTFSCPRASADETAADTDGDGIPDSVEIAGGYDPNTATRIVYVDASRLDDSGDGLSELTAKRSIKAGVEAAKVANVENVVIVGPGIYAGEQNREIDFGGFNIKLQSKRGSPETIVDLQQQGIFLHVKNHESKEKSWLDGFTIRNGKGQYNGGAVEVGNSSGLTVKNCVFRDNRVGGSGGAIYTYNSNVDILNSKFLNNRYKENEDGGPPEMGGGAVYIGSGTYNISNCQFLSNTSQSGGALYISSGTVNLNSCVFRSNVAEYSGGAVYVDYSVTLTMVNCLAFENSANYYGFMNTGYESNTTIRNCTIFGNTTRNDSDLYIYGNFEMYNTIFRGTYSGSPTTIAFCCATQDFTSLGDGNITADPKLTPAGYLKSDSPCIDTGSADYAPETDLDGQQRPAGSAPDIGCYEFLDSDGDGIPDSVEIASGLNPNDPNDANGDADNDGLTNLNEFLNGTNPGNADTDGDGIPDNVEIAQGYNPTLYTLTVYVDPAKADDGGDGLTQATAKKTIKAALDLASGKGVENVLMLMPGTYSGADNRNFTVDGLRLRIRSLDGSASTIIDLGETARFIHLKNNQAESLIEGITFRNGNADYGSAVRLENYKALVRNCVFENNYCSQRGALYIGGVPGKIVNSVFRNNEADRGGAVALIGAGETVIENTTFMANYARNYGAALYLNENASVNISGSKFLYNRANVEGAGISMAGNGTLILTNSLFNFNRARNQYSDIETDNGSQRYTLTNVTMINSQNPNGNICRFEGSATITNCIMQGNVIYNSDRKPVANNNCVKQDWSTFGSNNITAEPKLSLGGYPLAGSPCIDAGRTEDAPAKDLDGTSRPAGSGVEIGCYEFLDSDGDGIPDAVENLAGLNPNDPADAASDLDGDGISNIDEFMNGTSLSEKDTDGDGIDDNIEIANGYDPTLYTRVIYVDAVSGNDGNSGLKANFAKKSIKAAVNASKTNNENLVLVQPGVYSEADNRGIDFGGYNIKIRSVGGAADTIVDLEGEGPFITLQNGETTDSWLDGFTVKNGYAASYGIALYLKSGGMDIRNCIFENNKSGKLYRYQYGESEDEYDEEWQDSNCTAAVYVQNWPVRITNTIFRNNSSRECYYGGDGGNAGAINLISSHGSIIDRCRFIGNRGYNAGAIVMAASNVEITNSRFSDNLSLYNGGAICGSYSYYSYEDERPCVLTMRNCLLAGNRALNDYSDLSMENSFQTYLYNVTVSGGSSKNRNSIYLSNTSKFVNCIIAGNMNKGNITFTAFNNCNPADWSSYGSGNITADPKLTRMGYLQAGSPCIDAGSETDLIPVDIDGVARTAGTVDMGCQEFRDSDNDGIPDNIEIAAGLNPNDPADAALDKDSDGLKNLDEYLLGSNIAVADSDGDGIPDGEEVTQGYDPVKITRFIYADDAAGNDENDGLSAANAKKSLKAAIAASQECNYENVILVSPGTYKGKGNKNLDYAGYNIKMRSLNGAAATIIDLENEGRFLYLTRGETRDSWFDGFTVKNGNSDYGSALRFNHAAMTIKNCVFDHNNTSNYGAVYNGESLNLLIENCRFVNNTASRGPGYSGGSGSTAEIRKTLFQGNRAGGYGGAVYVESGTKVKISQSRILNNQAGNQGGAVFLTSDNSGIEIENSLLSGNWSREGYSDISSDNGSHVCKLANVTMINGIAPSDYSCRFESSASITNSIIQGHVAYNRDRPIVANNNCVDDDWSELGTGNLSVDPGLTTAGYLMAGSPCIDSGKTEGAPTADIDGVARPAGNGIDIGCQEFLDSDGDGIPDNVEIASGLNPHDPSDAALDSDGDGISNLDEYRNGSTINSADSDGDGISDKDEIALGYDPVRYTRVIYVDNTSGNDGNNGLTPANAKKTIGAAVTESRSIGNENIIMVAAGTYKETGNRKLDFGGYNIKLRSISGAADTIVDLEGDGPFLTLQNREDWNSWIDGFTFKNGYTASYGIVIYLNNAGLDIRNCIFENNQSGKMYRYQYGEGEDEYYEEWQDANSTAAVYAQGYPIRVTNTVFRNNTSRETMYGGMDGGNSGAINLISSRGTVIDRCRFIGNRGYNAGAIVMSGSETEITNSRFLFNHSYYNGGAISGSYSYYSYEDERPSTLTMKNCLMYGNRAVNDYSDLCMDNNYQTNLYQVTIAGGAAKNRNSVYFAGDSKVVNSIITGNLNKSNRVLVANNNCNPADWSSYGSGNITADPKLTRMGYLEAGSPCIDAGSDEDLIPVDIDGVVRTPGSVGMGCQKFKDSDNDGIPDNVEVAAGLNPNDPADAVLDKDNDGVKNLDEYLYGTNIAVADSDGDGIPDGEEIAQGYNPAYYTRIVYVNAASGNDENDGLTAATAKKTLKKAIEASQEANYENVILAAAGTYSGKSNRNLDYLGFNIKLRSMEGAEKTVIDLEKDGRFLYLTRGETLDSWIDGFTIRNGNSDYGSALRFNHAVMLIKNCIFDSNTTSNYGAVYNGESLGLKIDNCRFTNNTADRGPGYSGGGSSTAEIHRTLFQGNRAGRYGGAAYLEGGSKAKFFRSRFLNNQSGEHGGAIFVTSDNSGLEVENSLFNGNWGIESDSDIASDNGSHVCKLQNVTILNGISKNGRSCRFEGPITVNNSIIQGKLYYHNARPLVANNNFSWDDWSLRGANNSTSEPMLTQAGYLAAGSPCIDAGLAAGAPNVDIDGVERPYGNGVDIGCQEFKDSDGDGIPDNVEIASGLNPNDPSDATLDTDGDGISNRDEYLAGTAIGSADADGDGIPDKDEIALGYDPARYTQVIYVDTVNGNNDNDGLSAAKAKQTIGAAIAASQNVGNEKVILVAAGTYKGTGNKNLDFFGYDVKLRSISGAEQTVIDMENDGRFLYLTRGETLNSWIDGFTLRNGNSDYGSALRFNHAVMTIKNCVFDHNNTSNYGAVYNGESIGLLIENCRFMNNTANRGPGYSGGSGSTAEIRKTLFQGNRAGSYGGAVYVESGTKIKISQSRILNNQSGEQGGAIFVTSDNSGIEVENTLFNGNWSRGSHSDIASDNGGHICKLTNVTIINGNAPNDWSCRFESNAVITNSIIRGHVAYNGDRPIIADNNCVIDDWSERGSGNITVDPKITPVGYLLAGSPCIDAGSATGALAADIDGVTRPAGARADIGCQEFVDSDGDGIPDNIEVAAGLNPNDASDAVLDKDSDGVSNLDEYCHGSTINSADSDGDGISDKDEIALGYEPYRYTQVIYVDGSNGSDDNDGMSLGKAKKTISAAITAVRNLSRENVVMIAAGTYKGTGNLKLDFGGYNIKLRSISGAADTIIDLEGDGPFLTLQNKENRNSWLDGFTIRNGYTASYGIAVYLNNAGLDIRNCVFEGNKSGKLYRYQYGEGEDEYYEEWQDSNSTAAVYAQGYPIRMTNTVFRNNTSRENYYGGDGGNSGAMNLISSRGTVIDHCRFIGNRGYSGGAIVMSGSETEITNSRFLFNHSYYNGGAIGGSYSYYSYEDERPSTLTMKNCLMYGNRAVNDYSDLCMDNNYQTNLYQVTIAGGAAKNRNSVYFAGDSKVVNSIITGNLNKSNRVLVANNNCNPADWSSYGSGNITADPKLTRMGYLEAGSPCIDSGSDEDLIPVDIDGVVRTVGRIDMGCQEFKDSDNDGIPDNVEVAAGLNPNAPADAVLDKDGDGVNNLDEYLYGTNIAVADSDGDGIPDGEEIAQGYNPAYYTRIVYVNAASGNDENNGLTAATAKKTLKKAIEASQEANYENVILAAAGTYSGKSNRNLDYLGFNIKLRSIDGPETTVIDLEKDGRFLYLTRGETLDSWIDGFTIRNGNSDYGSALRFNHAVMLIKNSIFDYNNASNYGTVYNGESLGLKIENCRFTNNTADRGPGYSGGGSSTAEIHRTLFQGNRAGRYGGAAYLEGGTKVKIYQSRFLNNQSGEQGGAIFVTSDNSGLEVENSLFNGNWSRDYYSDIVCDNGSHICKLVNVTMLNGISKDGWSCRFEGHITIQNSILQGRLYSHQDRPLVADNNCSIDDWSSYGSGNLSVDPQLTKAGYLTAGSPCIDSGKAAGAPAIDIDGVARPAGSGIDMGCQEFKDGDGDGIPDNVELAAGLNPNDPTDATLDADGDGVNNLDEYRNGSSIGSTDSDGDGISDKDEIALGYDPARYTQVIYVDGPNGSNDNDGLTPANAKKTIEAGIVAARHIGNENIVMVASGTYKGTGNRKLDFGGYNIKLRSISGAALTIVDLEGEGPFLTLQNKENVNSWLDGFTIRNGYTASYGIAVYLNNAGMDIRNCLFENNNSGKLVRYEYGEGQYEEYWQDANSTAAVYAQGWPVRVTNTIFRNNTSRETMYGGDGGNCGALNLISSRGTVIDHCRFIGNRGYGAGAVVMAGCEVEVTNSRFIGNHSFYNGGAISGTYSYYGGGDDTPPSILTMKNCLLLGNRAVYNYSDLNMYEFRTNLYNTTIANGSSRDGSSLYLPQSSVIKNSIITGNVNKGNSFVAKNNCNPSDWSAFGAGNITLDPKLTATGYLQAGSPCIDSGSDDDLIVKDIDGVTRVAGSVDMGAQEFVDSDSDGIPDNVEIAVGMNPNDASDAQGDLDNDGVKNFSEYLNGTKINVADSDGDGIADGVEIANGYNPAYYTRVIYVSTTGSDDNDGLTVANAVLTLKKAIMLSKESNFENVIMVAAGTYSGADNKNLDFEGYNIKLRSTDGAAATIIDLENNGRFIYLTRGETQDSWLDGFTIRNGSADYGSALRFSQAAMTVKNCVFNGNKTSNYGAIYAGSSSNLLVENSKFENNTASRGAAFAGDNSRNILFNRVIFQGNRSSNYGGAIYLDDSEVKIVRSRFIANQSSDNGGAIWLTDNTSKIEIANSLFNYNWALNSHSDIALDNGNQTAKLMNVTILNGISKDNSSCYFTGQATVTNCIFTRGIGWHGDHSLVANHCFSGADWSERGAGNITGDAKLNNMGYLLAGSPCISAGTTLNAPSDDLDGVARTGNRIDIGCQQFVDSDNDGIPDNVETAAGLNPADASDATLDKDGDGLSNLREYQLGTRIDIVDSDGDGISDAEEVEQGYNPLVKTRIVYADARRPDDTGDGLTEATAKQSIKAAVNAAKTGWDNVVLVKPGRYSGANNRDMNFDGYNIRLRSMAGKEKTIVDLTEANVFLSLNHQESKAESWLDGFSFLNGNGRAPVVTVDNAGLSVRNCVFNNHNSTKEDDYYYYGRPGLFYLEHADLEFIKSEITNCNFNLNNNLFYTYNSRITMNRVQVSGNDSGSSELIYLYNSTLDMVNCLFVRNNNASTGNVFRVYNENSSVKAINSTIAYNTNGVSEAFSNSGTVELLNTIMLEKLSGGNRTLNYCCTSEDFSNLGENNIQADPLLSKGGFLMPDSPCIDAGRLEGAPREDIVGSLRPFGDGIDIGSEEFADADGDGISDYYEAMCGGDLDAEGDADGDGLSNLQEYQLGTNALKADSDDDGMPDGWEVTNNLNPLRNDARDDADGDGLLNVEEYEAGTDPNVTDTDGDGKSDYWEAKEAFSDPTKPDFDGNESLVMTVNGNTFTNSNGGWEAEGATAFIRDRSGWVEYSFNVATQGVYQLELEVAQRIENASTNTFNVSCYVDGGFSSTKRIEVAENGIGKARYFMPLLKAGNHTVKFVWSNVYRNTTLQINNFKLYSLSGPDENGNGVPDWVESRLENMSAVILPPASKTSPLCVEGGNATFIEQINITGFYTPEGETPETPAIQNAAFNRWFANVPLDPDGGNSITVNISYQNDAQTVSKQVAWETTDVVTQNTIAIRKDDSLKLTAGLPVDYTGTYTITVEDREFELNKGESMPYKFENAGNIPVTVKWTPSVGAPETHSTMVQVRSAVFNGNPICYVDTKREWANPGIGEDIVVEADRNIDVVDYGMRGSDRVFSLESKTLGLGYITARLSVGGPILSSVKMRVIDATTHVNDGYHQIISDFGDGTALYDGYIVVDHVVEGMQIYVTLWGSNTLFEDGTREKWFDASQFDANGELHYNVLAGSNFTTCQSIYLYQNGVLVKQLQ